jgi:signal-transduction protein with cAMP-binding, CBS, and nucleotidyltransferase domain
MSEEIESYLEEIENYMSSPVLCVDWESNAQETAVQMHAMGVGALLVKKGDDYIGIVSESDFTRKVVAAGLNAERTKVTDIMTSPILTMESCTPVEEAENFMARNKIRHMAVTEADRIVGMLSVKDLVSCYSQSFRMTE